MNVDCGSLEQKNLASNWLFPASTQPDVNVGGKCGLSMLVSVSVFSCNF